MHEFEEAWESTLKGEALGTDGIPAELLKPGGSYFKKNLHSLICKMWQKGKAPADLKFAKFTRKSVIRASAETVEESRFWRPLAHY